MKRFTSDEQGYALILTLLFMPVFLGLALMIIDVSRGNNAHSDLYAAADAMALAAAGELDGGSDAIDRAELAMAEIANTVSFLSVSPADTNRDIAPGEYTAIFLTDIPTNDETPIDQAWVDANGTTSGEFANFVYVRARPVDGLSTLFPDPVSLSETGDVAIWATAVAGRREVICDITPLFICNPFEGVYDDLQEPFSQGLLHGRIMRLHPGGQDTAGPGNFAFLDVECASGGGAACLKDYFSGEGAAVCYDTDGTVETKPGNTESIKDAMNIRFDVWPNGESYKKPDFVTANNVRKGFKGTPACDMVLDDTIDLVLPGVDAGMAYEDSTYTGFPDNENMSTFAGPALGAGVGDGPWNIHEYFVRNHGLAPAAGGETDQELLDLVIASLPGGDGLSDISKFPTATPPYNFPSRYDVYKYENKYEADPNFMITGSGAENGNPMCSSSNGGPAPEASRRLIQAAIVNCLGEAPEGVDLNGKKDLKVEAYVSIFLVRPWQTDSGGTIDVEIEDITGAGGLGTLDSFVRVEGILVR